jgi:hypothetical protein
MASILAGFGGVALVLKPTLSQDAARCAASIRSGSLSGILCVRHSMTPRSMNATQSQQCHGGQEVVSRYPG